MSIFSNYLKTLEAKSLLHNLKANSLVTSQLQSHVETMIEALAKCLKGFEECDAAYKPYYLDLLEENSLRLQEIGIDVSCLLKATSEWRNSLKKKGK